MKMTTFDRVLYNDLKLGAYYTDTDHAARLGQMFELQGSTCCLEPSVGDGTAVKSFLDACIKKEESNISLFGVELDSETYEKVKDKLHFGINEDFLKGVRITPKSFSLCFANPPYGTNSDGSRLELEFIKKIYSYMRPDGYLIYIIPKAALDNMEFSREFMARMEPLKVYRFDNDEYAKYHQYAIIAKRRKSIGVQIKELEVFRNLVVKDQFPCIPALGEYKDEIFLVPESREEEVTLFTSITFDYAKAARNLVASAAFEKGYTALVKPYSALNVGDPPVPLKKDLLYLCSIAGAGEGMAGCEQDGDLHLQRGLVTKEEFTSYTEDEKNESMREVITTRAVVSINVMDNFGNIHTLK